MRQLITFSLLCLIAMVGGAFFYQTLSGDPVSAAPPKSQPPEMAPGFVLKDVNGTPQSSEQWADKYQLLNFWATWCPPCRREIPMLNSLQDEYGPQGLQIVGIAIDQAKTVADYGNSVKLNYPSLVGQMDATKAAEAYGNPIGALPYSVLVGPDGKILFSHMGELEREQIDKVLQKQLSK